MFRRRGHAFLSRLVPHRKQLDSKSHELLNVSSSKSVGSVSFSCGVEHKREVSVSSCLQGSGGTSSSSRLAFRDRMSTDPSWKVYHSLPPQDTMQDAIPFMQFSPSGGTISPNSRFHHGWSALVFFAILISCLVVPLEFCLFTVPHLDPPNAVSAIDWALDVVFILDFCFNWNIAFEVVNEDQSTFLVTDRYQIALRYLHSWCVPDLVSAIPVEVFCVDRCSRRWNTIKLIRVVRLLRVRRQLNEVSRRFAEVTFHKNVALVGWLFLGLLVTHVISCVWALAGQLSWDEDDHRSWVMEYQENSGTDVNLTRWSLYQVSLYWGITTLTSIGYGDIAPQNMFEIVICSVLMLVGALSWTCVMAYVIDAVGSMGSEDAQYLATMDKLKLTLQQRNVSDLVQRRVRAFYTNVLEQRHNSTNVSLLQVLSPQLRAEVAFALAQESVNAVWFFRQNGEHVCRYRFLVAIAWRLQPIVYASDEAIFHERSLTIVRRGLVFHSRRLLTRGQTFGDDMLLNAPELINKEAALSLTAVQMMTLSRRHLDVVLDSGAFWDEARIIRRAAIRLAIIRLMLVATRHPVEHRSSRVRSKGDWLIELLVMHKLGRQYTRSHKQRGIFPFREALDGPSTFSRNISKRAEATGSMTEFQRSEIFHFSSSVRKRFRQATRNMETPSEIMSGTSRRAEKNRLCKREASREAVFDHVKDDGMPTRSSAILEGLVGRVVHRQFDRLNKRLGRLEDNQAKLNEFMRTGE